MNVHIDKIKKNSTPVVLFGAGDLGVLAYHALKKREVKVNFVCDSNPRKQGKMFYGIKIISPDKLFGRPIIFQDKLLTIVYDLKTTSSTIVEIGEDLSLKEVIKI